LPEACEEATILIATSFQALQRLETRNKATEICDCTITILFAAFFIEANLNYILNKINAWGKMEKFLGKNKRYQYPGLQDKLLWFYNEFIARHRAPNKNSFKQMDFYRKIRRKFPGFSDIYKFRNEISHGNINMKLARFDKAKDLRIKSKDIVDNLFGIMEKAGYKIPRDNTYPQVISKINP
jgi:hypothetical protein